MLRQTIRSMDKWMQSNQTDPDLRDCITQYALGRGGVTMEEICRRKHPRFQALGQSQDTIGWRRFMEGMISKECANLQRDFLAVREARLSISAWSMGLITNLLEITHGQWLYRNMQVHDAISGAAATRRKEEIQMEIERQQDLGADGLLEEDHYMLEINLEDLESSSGERQEYWLLAIKAARAALLLRQQRSNTSVAGETEATN